MRFANNPIRLFAEILGIVAVSELLVMLAMPYLDSGLGPLASGLLDVALLLGLAGPAVYWRSMAITRNVAQTARPGSSHAGSTNIRMAVLMTAAAQFLGLCMTGAGVWWQSLEVERAAQVRFDRGVDRMENEVKRRMELPLYGLTGARAAYASSENVTHSEFRDLVQALDVEHQFAGVRGFGFVERVLRTDLDGYVKSVRASGMPDFKVQTSGEAADLYVIRHVEPLAKNYAAWGFDESQEATRRDALERAISTGTAALSGRITLVQDETLSPAFIYALPVFRSGLDPESPSQRMAALKGLLVAPMVVSQMMGGAVDVAQEAVALELFDGDPRDTANLLHQAYSQLSGLDKDTPQKEADKTARQTTRVFEVGSRFLHLRVSSTPAFEASLDRSNVALAGVGGVLASLLGALAVWLLASGRLRAQNLARRMTSELDTMARVVRITDNAVVITDADLRITWVNDGFTRMSGYTLAEALGQKPGELLGTGKTPAETIFRLMHAAEAGLPCRVEVLNRTKDGREYWLDTDVHPLRNERGELVSFMEVGTDITAQKQAQLDLESAQQRLTELSDRLNLAVEGGSDGLWDWMDLNADGQWWSPSYYGLLGYTAHELPPTSANFVSLVHPDDHDRSREAMDLALHHGKPYDHELRLRTRDHGYRWFRSRAKVFRDVHGSAVRMAGSAQDIHDRKEAEAEVERASALLRGSIDALNDAFVLYDPQDKLVLCNHRHREIYPLVADVLVPGNSFEFIIRTAAQRGQYLDTGLDQETWVARRLAQHAQAQSDFQQTLADGRILRVSERRLPDGHTVGFRVDVTDFIRATEAAEAASRSKSQFLANMSHEIRTPMNAILGMLKLLQNTELTTRQQDYAGKTEGAARSLLGLLNDILDFSKVEAGKMTLDPRPFRLDRLMRDLSVILSANVGNKGIEVLFDVDAQVPRNLVGDDMRLQQVLINLGGNAIKFTNRGEVVLKLRVVERSDTDVLLEFAVRDSGIGIAPENQTHIFSGFSQAEASTTRRFGGTGLGLAISSRLVRLLGGEMALHSVPGEGSTFSFQLRLGLTDEEESPAALAPAQTHAQRTLVVDDNAIARDLMAAMAGSLGWKTDAAASGEEALVLWKSALAEGRPYEVVFVDWQMPKMDGWETSHAIRETLQGAPDTPAPLLFMVTAHGRDMLAQRNAQEQATLNGFLVKPVTASMLLDAVMDGKSAALTAATGHNPAPAQRATKPKRLPGMRLLVVEDNKINQAVAQGLLSQEGAIVTLADNGRLGVDAVLTMQPAYDAVLMDLQMPVMDGFEATRAIRQSLGQTRLPIIAMTANAMASDREACLAAGMNDHVGKPFELDHLVAKLHKHTGFASAAGDPVQAAAPAAPGAHDHPPGDLDMAGALERVGGDEEIFSTVLRAFADEMLRVPDQVQAQLASGDQAQAVRVLHTLKGLAATVGARHLAAVALAFEQKVANGTPAAEHESMLAALHEAIHALSETLAPVLLRYEAPHADAQPARELDRDQLRRELITLARLLQNSELVALEVHALIQNTFAAHLAQELRPLKEAMASLDFKGALAVCEGLIQRHCD